MLYGYIKKRSRFLLFCALLCVCFVSVCIAEYLIFYRKISDTKNEYKTAALKTADTLDFTVHEIQRLSQLLLINSDLLRFVVQSSVGTGSSDIQTLIDAQRHLSYVKSIHPAVEDVYVYAKNSDYLLTAGNAFFDIDRMYNSLFAFEGLNSGQWRTRYLRPVHANEWLNETVVSINGRKCAAAVFAQTFPLQNASANIGKLIVLLKKTYLQSLIDPLFSDFAAGEWAAVFNDNANDLCTCALVPLDRSVFETCRRALKGETLSGQNAAGFVCRKKINKRMYTVFIYPLTVSGAYFAAGIPGFSFLKGLQDVRFIVFALVPLLLFACALCILKFLFYTVFNSAAAQNINFSGKTKALSSIAFERKQNVNGNGACNLIENTANIGEAAGTSVASYTSSRDYAAAVTGAEKTAISVAAAVADTKETAHFVVGAAEKTANSAEKKSAQNVYDTGTDTAMAKRISAYIQKNYSNQLLNISQMAQDFGTKESFLYHFFKSRMNKSFACYLEDFRLENARSVFQTDMKACVNVLAGQCGYANPQTFRRAFKKKYGLTPSEFKQQVFATSNEL